MKHLATFLLIFMMLFVLPLDEWKKNDRDKNTQIVLKCREQFGKENPDCEAAKVLLFEGILNMYILIRCMDTNRLPKFHGPIFMEEIPLKKEAIDGIRKKRYKT